VIILPLIMSAAPPRAPPDRRGTAARPVRARRALRARAPPPARRRAFTHATHMPLTPQYALYSCIQYA